MLIDNRRPIQRSTVSFLRSLISSGDLDESSYSLVFRVLEKSIANTFSSWTFELASALGASVEAALNTGVFAELVFASLDLIDDIEDNHSNAYLNDIPVSAQTNLALQMFSLSILSASKIERQGSYSLIGPCCAALSSATCGQAVDLLTTKWTEVAYLEAGSKMGRSLELYLRAAAASALRDPSFLLPIVKPTSLLALIRHDQELSCLRLQCLSEKTIQQLFTNALTDFDRALEKVPREAHPVFGKLRAYLAKE